LGFFREHAQEFGFRPAGYLWLYDDPDLFARARAVRALQNSYGLGVELLEPGEIGVRAPVLDRAQDELVGATSSPYDGLVNPDAGRHGYRARAGGRGVRFRNRHYAAGVVTARVAGAGGSLRRVQALEVVEVARQGVLEDATALREILVTHRVAREQV